MRIDELHLFRYGKFTDFTLEFGQHQVDTPDLHIIYGPNEAGKTTLMSAYLDFLFGFPQQPTYNFKHANNVLKVGGVIRADNKTHVFQRLKKNKNSLVDASEQPADDGILLQQLAGLGKSSYKNMFSLNDVTLIEGGESILASEGELGKLLYSATTGVAQLSDALLRMRTTSELFYKKGKRKFELAELRNKLKQIDNERKTIDIEARTYAKLAKQRNAANTAYKALDAELDTLKLHIQKLRRKKTAYPRLISLKRLQQAMHPLEKLPDIPNNWIDEVKQLQLDSIKTETIALDFIEKIQSIDKAIQLIVPDEAALAASHMWKHIEQEQSSFQLATNNLPDIEQLLRDCNTDIEGYLYKLGKVGIDNPRSLVLDAITQSAIKDLIKQYPDLLAQVTTTKKELASAKDQLTQNEALFTQNGDTTDSATHSDALGHKNTVFKDLELAVTSISNNALTTDFQTTLHKKVTTQDELHAIVNNLSPWKGSTENLSSLIIPHASELQSLQRLRDDIATRTSNETVSLRDLNQKLSDLQAQQKSYTTTELIDDAQVIRLRAQRETAWEHHKSTLDAHTADVFEKAMRQDDSGQATRLQHTETLATLAQLSRDIIVVEESIANCQTKLEQLSKEQAHFNAEFSQLKDSISPLLNNAMTIEAVVTWIETQTDAIRLLHQLRKIDRELESIDSEASKACKHVLSHLERASDVQQRALEHGNNVDKLNALIKSANSTLKQHSALAGLQSQLKASQQQFDTRNRECESAQQLMDKWTLDWQQACSNCWLGANNAIPTTTIVDEFLQQLTPLEKQLGQQVKLEEKVAQHQQTIASFRQRLTLLADELSVSSSQLSTEQLYQTLLLRMDKAANEQNSLDDKQSQKNSLLEQRQINQTKNSVIQASIAAKSAYFSVDTIEEIQTKIAKVAEKQNLQERIDNEQNELLSLLEVNSLSEATNAFAGFDSDEAQLELDKLDRTATDLDLALREAHTAQQDAQRAVENVGGDDAVALLNEQRANLLLEMEEKTTHYLQQHLALNAADAALKVYRDNHRSSMIKQASDAFARITQGRYSRLETFQNGVSEQLVAIDKDGGSKESSALSKGTRLQLFLALRIAGYHEYAKSRPPVPFIADDILETSDDERAKQTFDVLGDMALVGQVIYLTHHQHLCAIAKQTVPGCTVHHLP